MPGAGRDPALCPEGSPGPSHSPSEPGEAAAAGLRRAGAVRGWALPLRATGMPRRWGWLPAPARVAPAPAVVAHLPQLCCAVAPMGAGFCWAQLCLLELFPSAGPRPQHPFPSELSPRPAPVPEVVPRRCPGAPAGRHEVKGARAPGSCPAALEEALLGPELRARSCGGRAAGQEWERGGRTPLAPAERWKVRGELCCCEGSGAVTAQAGAPLEWSRRGKAL